MVKVIIGGTGSGKTKALIDQVNAAVKEEKGNVVCICYGKKLTFDISYGARLVDATESAVHDYTGLLGFLYGIHAGNYDISYIFIDGLYKIVGTKDAQQAEAFLKDLEEMASKFGIKFTVALSQDAAETSEAIKKYM